jgi:KDO2-lipid IV(A) lauroyltransferase
LTEFFLLWAAKLLARFLQAFPARWARAFGRLAGRLACVVMPARRNQVYLNLKRAFGGSRTPAELQEITGKAFIHFAQNLVDLLRLPALSPDMLREMVRIEGLEHIEAARRKNKGLITISAHFGNWELYSAVAGILKLPYHFSVKPQHRHRRLNDLLNRFRMSHGSRAVMTGIETRNLVAALNRNEIAGFLIDQGGKDGLRVGFLKHQACYHPGAIRLAIRKGVPVIFSVLIRSGDGAHRMIFHEPFELPAEKDAERNVRDGVEKIVRWLEPYVEQYPWEYMWFYKVWKYAREVSILIIHDGKTGHLRQSQAVAASSRKIAESLGWACRVEEVEVKFLSKWRRAVFELWSLWRPAQSGDPRLRPLKWFLTPQSWQELNRQSPDWVVSCGSALAGLNVYLSRANCANNMAIQRPGLQPFKNFHTVFLPQHDAGSAAAARNLVVTRGAPNLIDEEYLDSRQKLLLNRYSHLKNSSRPFFGVLIGGDSRDVFISENQARILTRQLKGVSRDLRVDLLVTTSRRTPARVEQVFRREFQKDQSCPLLILAGQNTVPEAVGGILGLAKVAVVSGDSISMVSEAASSGKTTVVFMAEERNGNSGKKSKQRRFIEALHDQGHIISTGAHHVGQTLLQVMQGKLRTIPLRDRAVIEDRLRKAIF